MSSDFTAGFFGSLPLPQSECYLAYFREKKIKVGSVFLCMLSFIHEVTEPTPLQRGLYRKTSPTCSPRVTVEHNSYFHAQMRYTVDPVPMAEPEFHMLG